MAAPGKRRQLIEREERRRTVAANFLAGLTFRQIAEATNCGLGTVSRDVEAIVERWQKEQVQLVGEQRQVDLQRLDLVLNAIWERVLHGDLSAIDRYMKVAEHRARLLGLYAPQKTAFTDPEGVEATDPLAPVRELFATLTRMGENLGHRDDLPDALPGGDTGPAASPPA